MMKVLFLTNTPAPYRVEFFNQLSDSCDLTVAFETKYATDRDKNWHAEEDFRFSAVFITGFRVGVAERVSLDYIKLIRSQQFDIIVVGYYSSPAALAAILYMKIHKIPFIISTDGGVAKAESRFVSTYKTFLIGSAQAWLSPSKASDQYLVNYGAALSQIFRYPFTSIGASELYDNPASENEKIKLRDDLGIPETKVVISVGRFIPRKGFDLLLESVKDIDPSVGIYIIGGSVTDEYRNIISGSSVENVHFLPFMNSSELFKYYRAADLFVMPTRRDVWGLVINEALVAGLPIITTDQCGAGVELVHGNGLVVPVDVDWKKCIDETLKDNLQALSLESIKIAKTQTYECMVNAHIQCFETFLKSGR